jgi:hypothetical protein
MKRRFSVLEEKEIVTSLIITEELFMMWLFYSPNPEFISLFLRVSKKFKNWIVDFISMEKKLKSYQPQFEWIDTLMQNMNPNKSQQSFYDHKALHYNDFRDLIVFYKDDDGVVSFANAMALDIDSDDEKIQVFCGWATTGFTIIDNLKKRTTIKPATHLLLWDPISFAVEEWRRKNLKELINVKLNNVVLYFK